MYIQKQKSDIKIRKKQITGEQNKWKHQIKNATSRSEVNQKFNKKRKVLEEMRNHLESQARNINLEIKRILDIEKWMKQRQDNLKELEVKFCCYIVNDK